MDSYPWGRKESDTSEQLTHTHNPTTQLSPCPSAVLCGGVDTAEIQFRKDGLSLESQVRTLEAAGSVTATMSWLGKTPGAPACLCGSLAPDTILPHF